MHITLIRHGIAEEHDMALQDFDRALTPHGRKKLLKSLESQGEALNTIDIILCSPSLRTRQTCAVLCSMIDIAQDSILYDDAIYSFSGYKTGEQLLRHYGTSGFQHICLIGHNNSISSLASHLTGSPIHMKKGAVLHMTI